MAEAYEVLIVSSMVRFSSSVAPIVKKCASDKLHFAVSIADAQRVLMTCNISALIINAPLSDGFGLDFAVKCAKEKNYAVLMFIPDTLYEQAKEKSAPFGILTLPKPTSREITENAVSLLNATVRKINSLKSSECGTTDKMEELKLITHAKLILISSFGLSEERAHKYIEQRAMESRKTKTEIAKSIITSYSNR